MTVEDFNEMQRTLSSRKYGTYYNMDGEPITIDEWCESFQDIDARVVGRDIVGGYLVSTVLLGIDHGWHNIEPIIFETMIFDNNGEMRELYMDRYPTKENALACHKQLVQMLKDGKFPFDEETIEEKLPSTEEKIPYLTVAPRDLFQTGEKSE